MAWMGCKSLARTARRWRHIAPVILASMSLTACRAPDCPKIATAVHEAYAPCLARDESVTASAQWGAFTILDINRRPGIATFGTPESYKRLLHDGRPVVDRTFAVYVWNVNDNPVFFTEPEGSEDGLKSQFRIDYARDGMPVAENIGNPEENYDKTFTFPFGYPLTPALRYFAEQSARSAGYLLAVHPTRIVKLPMMPAEGKMPFYSWLAGMSPDGKAFAFIDDRDDIKALQVVDIDGASRAIVVVPPTSLPHHEKYEHPLAPAWRWFDATYAWSRNDRGQWTVTPRQ